ARAWWCSTRATSPPTRSPWRTCATTFRSGSTERSRTASRRRRNAMYRAFVRRRIRGTFVHQLSRGDYPAVVSRTARNVEHTFPGEGALAGTRRSRDALRQWFERLFRLFPELRFEVEDIAVTGWPWHTVVTVRWRDWGLA